ncbi:TPA: hypothetical protein ACH3X3_007408 [Trebouxia sp. C0006]
MGIDRTVAADAWTEPRLGRLCEVAAAAISPGRRNSGLSVSSGSCLETNEAADTTEHATNNFKVVEVDAFASVHDMIHAAIASYGKQATLREIYKACQQRGRIAYKRSGGSRLITHNDHWKSQIRHALYTCDRFARAADAHDLWTVSASFSRQQPQTTKVLIRTDPDAASVNDDSADAQRRQGHAKQPLSRQTRSKHTLDEPILRGTPKQKRSRMTRVAAKKASPGSSAAAARSRNDFVDTPSGSVAYSNGPSNRMLSGSDYSEMGERAASASAFQPYSCDASTAAGAPVQHEGEDESSHNDTCMQMLPQVYMHDGLPTSYEAGLLVQPSGVVHRGLPVIDVHPYFTECHDAHQIVASSMAAANAQNKPGTTTTHPSPDASLHSPHHHTSFHQLPSSAQHNSHHLTSTHPQQPLSQFPQTPNQPGLHRGLSSEAESQAEGQVYSLRSRSAPRVPTDPPSFQQSPSGQHSVHNFFMCHTKAAGPAAAPVPQSPSLLHQSSNMLSNVHDSPPIRKAATKQGTQGKPPVVPRGGRTHSLLAAAHKAQTAAFPTTAPYLSDQRNLATYQVSSIVSSNYHHHRSLWLSRAARPT